jgi:hypothetical protein
MPQTKARKKASRGGRSTKSRSSSRGSSNGRTKAPKKAVKKATKAPARAAQAGGVSKLLSKAKTPVIAGGAALAGLAGGMAIKQRNGGRGASMSKALMSTATAIGKTGVKAGELTDEIRKVREQVK